MKKGCLTILGIGLLLFVGMCAIGLKDGEEKTDPEPKRVVGQGGTDRAAEESRPSKPGGHIILANWETPSPRGKHTLVYQGGAMVIESEFYDGSKLFREVIERPADKPKERRFDLQPDRDDSEYITLSDRGVVKYFSWEGRQFRIASATAIHDDVMTVGGNPVARDCLPKQLSETSKEIIRLYEELHAFKDDPEFARLGFGQGGSYYLWLEAAERLHAETTPKQLLHELGFFAGDVMMLGLAYMRVATRDEPTESDKEFIKNRERTIQAGLSLATCR